MKEKDGVWDLSYISIESVTAGLFDHTNQPEKLIYRGKPV